jgi:hypothetical protein
MNATAIRRTRVGGFRAILGPVDFSKQSRVTLGYVAAIAKRIARKAGAPTDTSRDYELTDWTALDRFVAEAAAATASRQQPRATSL